MNSSAEPANSAAVRAEQHRRAAEDQRARGERRAEHHAGVVSAPHSAVAAIRRSAVHEAGSSAKAAGRKTVVARPVTSASASSADAPGQDDQRGERGGAHDVGGDRAAQAVAAVQPGADQRAGEHPGQHLGEQDSGAAQAEPSRS